MSLINTYDQLKAAVESGIIPKERAVAVMYLAREPRSCQSMSSQVYSPFFDTDPGSAWYNYKRKTFHGKRSLSFKAALEWASETYGIDKWKPNRMRDHVPAEVQDALPIPPRE